MRHEWTDGKRALALEDGNLYERGLTVEEAGQEEWLFTDVTRAQSAVFREVLRLAARVRELEGEETAEKLEAVIHALADALVDRDRLLHGVRKRLGLGDPPDEEFSIIRDQTFVQLERRIAALEEENRRLREGLGIASSFGGGTTCPDGEPHRAKCSRCDALLKLTPPGSAA